MNLMAVLVIGGVIGAVEGGSVFFARDEPYKTEIFLAATLKGVLVGLLTGLSLGTQSLWWQGAALGSLYGLSSLLLCFLPREG